MEDCRKQFSFFSKMRAYITAKSSNFLEETYYATIVSKA